MRNGTPFLCDALLGFRNRNAIASSNSSNNTWRISSSSTQRSLESYGIETAADVDRQRIVAVPGFGPATAAKLLAVPTLGRRRPSTPRRCVSRSKRSMLLTSDWPIHTAAQITRCAPRMYRWRAVSRSRSMVSLAGSSTSRGDGKEHPWLWVIAASRWIRSTSMRDNMLLTSPNVQARYTLA